MALLKCKTCGASLEIPSGTTVCECEYCGTKQTIDELEHAKNRAKKKSKRELEAERKAAQSKKMMWEMIISVTQKDRAEERQGTISRFLSKCYS